MTVLDHLVIAVPFTVDLLASWDIFPLNIILGILKHLLDRSHCSEGRRCDGETQALDNSSQAEVRMGVDKSWDHGMAMKIDDLGGLSFTALQIIAFVGNLQDFPIFDCHNLGFGVVLIRSVIQWVIHRDDIPIDVDGVSNLAILCGLSLMTGIHSVC